MDKSFSHDTDIALYSSFALETQLIIATKRNYILKEQLNNLEGKNRRVSKNDNGLAE